MGSRLEKLDAATDSKGNVKVLLTYLDEHAIAVELDLSAKFMKWFMQEYVNACLYTDVTIYVEDRHYTNFTEKRTVVNCIVPRANLGQDGNGQKKLPGLPGFFEVRKLTGLTEIKDSAMPNLRTEWMKLHS